MPTTKCIFLLYNEEFQKDNPIHFRILMQAPWLNPQRELRMSIGSWFIVTKGNKIYLNWTYQFQFTFSSVIVLLNCRQLISRCCWMPPNRCSRQVRASSQGNPVKFWIGWMDGSWVILCKWIMDGYVFFMSNGTRGLLVKTSVGEEWEG